MKHTYTPDKTYISYMVIHPPTKKILATDLQLSDENDTDRNKSLQIRKKEKPIATLKITMKRKKRTGNGPAINITTLTLR